MQLPRWLFVAGAQSRTQSGGAVLRGTAEGKRCGAGLGPDWAFRQSARMGGGLGLSEDRIWLRV